MDGLSLNIAQSTAVFLRDFGGYAMASIFLIMYVLRDRQYRLEVREKFELAMSVAPLADRLANLFDRAFAKARARARDSSPPPSLGGGSPNESGEGHG